MTPSSSVPPVVPTTSAGQEIDLLGALASALGVAREDLPTDGVDRIVDEPDVDPFTEPDWLD